MDDGPLGPPVVALPLPVDRRLRLGPFASAQDAVKFVCYGAAGALLVPFVGPFAWLPFVGVGFLLSAWRPEGEALDERGARWVSWQLRRSRGGGRVTGSNDGADARSRFLRPGSGALVAVLRVTGTPVAYRPPAELERLFRAWGELLRSTEGIVLLGAGTAPLAAGPLRPDGGAPPAGERAARAGYHELVSVLCRRRLVRRVDVGLVARDASPGSPARLDARARAAEQGLVALGLHPVRLVGRALREAGHRFGWAFPPEEAA